MGTPPLSTLLGQLCPFDFVNCLGGVILLDRTVVVTNDLPLPALVIGSLCLLGLPQV